MTHFAFHAKWDSASNRRAGFISPTPTVARSAQGLGSQAPCRRGTPPPWNQPLCPYILPRGAPQPKASLSDATAKYQTTYQAFPGNRCPQAELQACN